ncbi:MAG TPA: CheR family methyltransferase [Patescibacteria group bacterium]|nr:CheR family methyltransferase [Patescibacteria group bacterium]
MTKSEADILDIEVGLFLEALFLRHGYDFRHYAKASIRRRVTGLASLAGGRSVSDLISRTLRDPSFLPEILTQLSVPVTEMFRDPPVFKTLREQILPVLASWPRLKIWQAGCATGEEVYSLAIMLDEEGLLDRTLIYATDINDVALKLAEDGVFPLSGLEEAERRHRESGGRRPLADYCVSAHGFYRLDQRLREHIVFAHHNLVCDGVFCEVQAILCRNVLIYFDRELQEHVLQLFHNSLVRGGFLCLGTRESLRHAEARLGYTVLDREHRISRRAEEALP